MWLEILRIFGAGAGAGLFGSIVWVCYRLYLLKQKRRLYAKEQAQIFINTYPETTEDIGFILYMNMIVAITNYNKNFDLEELEESFLERGDFETSRDIVYGIIKAL
ncbi:hypothetical protein BKH46_08875 [Helicobacter sp. 12S02634-8]|uniref:hypothetical protein n=1 Tax=Helicobacter sp. 12S02634-8 TaxID=1476199 RepID=UPI000BA7CC34|nr:hypothetical protein [Helicobacter sp. 12S02634-8]PAF46149.1 hypothetical protein BKH46_08875 [Helicobacter sp. 12S02634-8]